MRKQLLLFGILCMCTYLLCAQVHPVTGSVTGLDGNPVPSATVSAGPGNANTVTDENGRFKISVADGATLTITSVGFETKEVQVKNQAAIYITLAVSYT